MWLPKHLLVRVSSNASNTVDSSNSSTGISVFGFIEKIAGQRDFFISTKLTFDMIDGAERKVFTVSFDMQIDNLKILYST